MSTLIRICLWALMMAAALPSSAQQRVIVPSLDQASGHALGLVGFWWPAAAVADSAVQAQPAMLLLHGCGGLYPSGRKAENALPAQRYRELAGRLNAMGVHVLALDSLSPRGEVELCTQKIGERKVTQRERRLDALGAMAWLAARAPLPVDVQRIGILGWSNGGSTVLAATNARQRDVQRAAVKPSLAVAFYPGCESDIKNGYTATARLLLLVGAKDDWTPAAPCEELARRAATQVQAAPAIEIEVFADAYHGFDGTAPLRLWREVPNGVNPGQGVHLGGHAPSREAAARRLDTFIRQHWALP